MYVSVNVSMYVAAYVSVYVSLYVSVYISVHYCGLACFFTFCYNVLSLRNVGGAELLEAEWWHFTISLSQIQTVG